MFTIWFRAKTSRVITFEEFQKALEELAPKRFKGQSKEEALQSIYQLIEGKDPTNVGVTVRQPFRNKYLFKVCLYENLEINVDINKRDYTCVQTVLKTASKSVLSIQYMLYTTIERFFFLSFFYFIFFKKFILLFSKDTLNWSKGTVKWYWFLIQINVLSIHQRILKKCIRVSKKLLSRTIIIQSFLKDHVTLKTWAAEHSVLPSQK